MGQKANKYGVCIKSKDRPQSFSLIVVDAEIKGEQQLEIFVVPAVAIFSKHV